MSLPQNKSPDPGRKESLWKRIGALLVVFLLGGTFMALWFIAKIAVSLIAILIARFAFETSWEHAFFIGVIAYFGIGFIELILEELPKRTRPRGKKSKG